MDLGSISQYLEHSQIHGNKGREVTGFAIDSRQLKPGDLFFALAGEKTDGHQFVRDVFKRGASGAVVARIPKDLEPELLNKAGLIITPDVLKALQKLALAFRVLAGIPVVAVTGSNGKTTTKDLIAAVLESKYQTLKTEGNFNNEIGLPLTLLRLIGQYQAIVVEMGMRGLGQIRDLCAIARPDYGVITNIGIAHFELLGSEERIAQAKGELLESLPEQGAAILNRDDPLCIRLGEELLRKRSSLRVLYYGLHPEAAYQARDLLIVDGGTRFTVAASGEPPQEAFIPLPGSHNVQNALAALAVGSLFQIPVTEAIRRLAAAKISDNRLAQVEGIRGARIINDTYNANPGSTIPSLEVLASLPGSRKIAVLGTQRELGTLTEKGHREIGEKVAELGIDLLVTLGQEARWIADEAVAKGMDPQQVYELTSDQEVSLFLHERLKKDDLVLVKGSRVLKMEKIVANLTLGEGGAD